MIDREMTSNGLDEGDIG